jgi:hypothetical protein
MSTDNRRSTDWRESAKEFQTDGSEAVKGSHGKSAVDCPAGTRLKKNHGWIKAVGYKSADANFTP